MYIGKVQAMKKNLFNKIDNPYKIYSIYSRTSNQCTKIRTENFITYNNNSEYISVGKISNIQLQKQNVRLQDKNQKPFQNNLANNNPSCCYIFAAGMQQQKLKIPVFYQTHNLFHPQFSINPKQSKKQPQILLFLVNKNQGYLILVLLDYNNNTRTHIFQKFVQYLFFKRNLFILRTILKCISRIFIIINFQYNTRTKLVLRIGQP
eukprot:TRINITY_DN5322_c2_g2_i4.p1 TRINITY_DN5322_c2_g2~~TRINITY_DN5322_c2_g2_i4.p1  ORF type:complete len:206 (+),score=-12.90 TRINITY_DN5322_c2_g2_i4:251-868(+)